MSKPWPPSEDQFQTLAMSALDRSQRRSLQCAPRLGVYSHLKGSNEANECQHFTTLHTRIYNTCNMPLEH